MVIVPQRWRSRFKTHGKLENPPTQRRFSGPTIGKTHRKYEKKQYRWRFIAGKIIHGDSANHVRLPEATGCLEDYTPNGNRIAQQTSTNDHHYWDFQHSSNGFQGCSQSQGEGLDTKKDLVKKKMLCFGCTSPCLVVIPGLVLSDPHTICRSSHFLLVALWDQKWHHRKSTSWR